MTEINHTQNILNNKINYVKKCRLRHIYLKLLTTMLHLLLVRVTDIEKAFDRVYPIEHLLLLSLVYLIVVV
jgi:hypothetical protein